MRCSPLRGLCAALRPRLQLFELAQAHPSGNTKSGSTKNPLLAGWLKNSFVWSMRLTQYPHSAGSCARAFLTGSSATRGHAPAIVARPATLDRFNRQTHCSGCVWVALQLCNDFCPVGLWPTADDLPRQLCRPLRQKPGALKVKARRALLHFAQPWAGLAVSRIRVTAGQKRRGLLSGRLLQARRRSYPSRPLRNGRPTPGRLKP